MMFNILDFGAVPDGSTDSTEAVQKAIDACSKEGGTVLIPAGCYLAGFLRLRSNMELHLEMGAVLKSNLDGNEEGYFLYACHERNLTISGLGMVDGQGAKRYIEDDADRGFRECPLMAEGKRPRTSYFEDVENLTIKDVTFFDAAFWTLHMAGCRKVRVDGIRILNNDRGPNNDGIDPDCCQNVQIANCLIETGDDAIVVKATKNMAKRYGACENIVISGCILHSRDSALKIGTESWGEIRNVVMSDCIVRDCSRGIGIWSRDGGLVSDIDIHHVYGNTRRYADCPERGFAPRWWGKGEPIFISASKRKEESSVPGEIRNITFDHIRFKSESCIFIAGESYAPICNVKITNAAFRLERQSGHKPGLFDEQPSVRDVYEHEIPFVYGRYANRVRIRAAFEKDSFMEREIKKEQILEQCTDFLVEDENLGDAYE